MGEGAATAEAASGGSKNKNKKKLSREATVTKAVTDMRLGRSDGAQLVGKGFTVSKAERSGLVRRA